MSPLDPIDALVRSVIAREGGYVFRPEDRGGPTKFGITLKVLEEWRGRPQSADDVARLEIPEASQIYKSEYLLKPRFVDIRAKDLRELVFDTGINHGRARASRWLQEAVRELSGADLRADGILGNLTLGLVNSHSPNKLFVAFLARRYEGFASFVRDDPTQSVFVVGWNKRANEFLRRLAP